MIALLLVHVLSPAFSAGGYPRIGNLWGVWPNGTDYDRYAKYDLLVSGGEPAAWRRFRQELQARHSQAILLGTVPLMNIGPPKSTPWMKDEWYLRRPSGEMINWWAGQVYAPNLLIDDCLEALLEQTQKSYDEVLKDKTIDAGTHSIFVGDIVGGALFKDEEPLTYAHYHATKGAV